MAYYITGDCHGSFGKLTMFCDNYQTSKDDVIILLGDVGLNFYLNKHDVKKKKDVSNLPITVFCVHGNHEERPFNIATYKEKMWKGGIAYYEEKFPDLLFAKDGEIYNFDDKKVLVVGGAYSVDKYYRILRKIPWFKDEQPSDEIKQYVQNKLEETSYKVDIVLSHTCPYSVMPRDLFLDIDQSSVDSSTEEWLENIASSLRFDKWYFGHFHENRVRGKYEMLSEAIKELGKDELLQRFGRPKFSMDEVVFFVDNRSENGVSVERYGRVMKIHPYGDDLQHKEISYDLASVEDESVLFECVRESDILAVPV